MGNSKISCVNPDGHIVFHVFSWFHRVHPIFLIVQTQIWMSNSNMSCVNPNFCHVFDGKSTFFDG